MARLERRGVTVVREGSSADLLLRVFATVLGVDKGETLIGTPALQAPFVLGPGLPEIALLKWIAAGSRWRCRSTAIPAPTSSSTACRRRWGARSSISSRSCSSSSSRRPILSEPRQPVARGGARVRRLASSMNRMSEPKVG